MAKPLGLNRLVLLAAAAAILVAATVAWTQSDGLTITLAGQSMIRSDLRVTDPAAMPVISSLLKGDVKFTNFEGVIAKPGQPNDRRVIEPSSDYVPPGVDERWARGQRDRRWHVRGIRGRPAAYQCGS